MLHGSSPGPSGKNSTVVRSQTAVRLARAALQAAYVVSDDLGTRLAERLFTSPRRHRRPEREHRVLASAWPFSIEVTLRSPRWHTRWRDNRRRIAAWRWGHGPAVLLVHGWEGRGAQLGAFVEPLVRAGMSVVAFDAPGHGDSPGSRLYLADMADCVADVAQAVGPLHAIVAHSFGAAAALMAHHRDRGQLIDRGGGAPRLLGPRESPRGGAVDARRNVMIAPNALIDDAVARFARTVALDDGDRTMLERELSRHNGFTVAAAGIDQLVGQRDAALLVVHDRDDREVPFWHGERLAATWHNATLRATSGLGHRQILRDVAVIAEVTAFVAHGVAPPASELVREVDRLLGVP